jgi:hypothetical protein
MGLLIEFVYLFIRIFQLYIGFVITNPTERWLHVVTAIGVRVSWDCRNRVTVVVPGRFKGKTCGLCGNNNGNAADDTINVADYPCVPPDKNCIATADAAPIIEKCDLMKNAPFTACNDAVDPTNFIEDCKFDACRCEDPMQCVCNSFATYSQSCSRNAVVLDWRFSGRYLVPALSQCGKVLFTYVPALPGRDVRRGDFDVLNKTHGHGARFSKTTEHYFLSDYSIFANKWVIQAKQ